MPDISFVPSLQPPAIAGGHPVFPEGLALVRPSVPDADRLAEELRKIFASGILTNGPTVAELESRAAEFLGVPHCVAVASCTAGLMLVLKASDLTGDVVLPSFTFAATAHAVVWNGLRPAFCDIDAATLTLCPRAAEKATGVRTSAILATHIYGTPCDVEALTALARTHGIRLFFDAAHAFGSCHAGRRVGGFGDAEMFSLTPTKVLVAGEGGIIATNDERLAQRCRIGRDYGNPGDYDCHFVGLNARMSEIHAAIALASLEGLEQRVEQRNLLAVLYREWLAEIPGIRFPVVPAGDWSTYKDFTILVDPEPFGLDAATLARSLASEGIETRRYYSPPVHAMKAYRFAARGNGDLRVTERTASEVLTLPLWVGMSEGQVLGVVEAVDRIHGWFSGGAGRPTDDAEPLVRQAVGGGTET